MALNTESTTGLLGGHTWQYGNKDGVASENITTSVLNVIPYATARSGEHLSIKKYDFNSNSYIEEKFIFCLSGTYSGSTGDIVNIGDDVGNSINSPVQGIAVVVANGAGADTVGTALESAFTNNNSQVDFSLVNYDSSTDTLFLELSSNVQDNTLIIYYDNTNTAIDNTSTTNVFGIPGWNGSNGFSGAETFSKLQPLYDELVSGGLFVNSISGSDEKAGLTRVNNSTVLEDPTTEDLPAQLAKAKTLARAYLAYKKKKK